MFARRKKIKTFYILMIGAILLLFVHRFFFPCFSYLSAVSSVVMYPMLLVQRGVATPIQQFFKRKKNRNELEQQLFDLQKKHETLLAENVKLVASLAYYKEIEELVSFNRRYKSEHALIAQILMRQLNEKEQTFLIDKGSRHGIQKDMVAVYKNGLVGRVTDVYALYSKVILVTDQSCKVAAHCSQSGTSGIHVGTNSPELTMLQRVSHLSSIKEGDLVISSGQGLVFPRGFSLGHIKTATPDGLYVAVTVEPLIDLRIINYCSVIKKGECDIA